jgi:hypothetical protein
MTQLDVSFRRGPIQRMMALALQHADSILKLLRNIVMLITSQRIRRRNKSRIMGPDERYILKSRLENTQATMF